MPGMMENVKTLNSVVRTLLALVIVGGVGVGAWLGLSTYFAAEWEMQQKAAELSDAQAKLASQRDEIDRQKTSLKQKDELLQEKDVEISGLNADIEAKNEQIVKLDTSLRLLKVDHRLANVKVLDIETGADGGTVLVVEFQEINDEGQPIDKAKPFRLVGDEIRIDAWVVQFDDKYVEEADLDRSTSICLFKRIYGNVEGPAGGFPIETIGSRPNAYARGRPMSEFEEKIWNDFWSIAHDSRRAEQLGIRTIGGKSEYVKARKGQTYRVKLRASGSTSLDAIDEDASP